MRKACYYFESKMVTCLPHLLCHDWSPVPSKEKVITNEKVESIKKFMEAKTFGPHDKTALENQWAPHWLGATFATSSGF